MYFDDQQDIVNDKFVIVQKYRLRVKTGNLFMLRVTYTIVLCIKRELSFQGRPQK